MGARWGTGGRRTHRIGGRGPGIGCGAVFAVLIAALLFAGALAALGAVRGADGEADADAAVADAAGTDGGWSLVLVNATHPLPDDFAVDTVEVGGDLVDARIAGDLRALLDAACEAGYDPFVRSGFRTRGEQQAILADRIAGYEAEGYGPEEARRLAGEWVAQPGTSEHELGLAVDLNDRADSDGLYAWLSSHAADFGFIQRYPDGTAAITGIAHEPWHYRYVGVEAAREISSRGITLEEYLGAA